MAGFNKQPTDFSSLMGYGEATPMNPYTGQPDYATALLSPELSGIPLGAAGQGQGQSNSWMTSIGDWAKDSGFLGSTATDGTKTQGWGGMALGAAQGIGSAYMGMKQYGIAKDTLAQNKKQFELNFGAQQKMTNANLADRQRSRISDNQGGGYESVGDYMKKYGV